ncbi:MAG: hypothetical protein A2Y97_04355 [Nitrospirae bacterium RBG_13_39_12]|nr:MAG: hypothetical protein A2Y97_04355 [Nitrospirae bacterium RBG_13_39_12]
MDKLLRNIILILFIFALTLTVAYADDLDPHYKFSGVKAPDSPYKNTWGAFQTDLFSGSFSYEYKIDVPPGTNGLTPEISFRYNSHSAKGKAGWVGGGWEIPLSYIQRNIQYTRKDTSDDTFELYLDGAKHDLVYVASENRWHTKNESYLKIEKKTGAPNSLGEYWIVTEKDGTEYRFGYNPASENLIQTSDASFTAYVWRWSLERIHDPNDNCICFNYIEDQGSVYLDNIKYNSCNNDGNRVMQFIRESKPDAYLIIDQGSEVYDTYRLSEIQIKVNGSLARKYKLAYTQNETQNKTLLTSITQYGADGVSSLPPVKFQYKAVDKGFGPETSWNTRGSKDIRKFDGPDGGSDTVGDTFDVNGDGLPDMVRSNDDYWDVWINNGQGFPEDSVTWPIPYGWKIRDVNEYVLNDKAPNTKSSPIDINGDGYVDFLWADKTYNLKVMINSGSSFTSVPDWNLLIPAYIRDVQRPDDRAANVEQDFFDMNGDGKPDLVRKENNDSWHVWRNTGNDFEDFGLWPVPHSYAWLEDFTRAPETNLQVGHFDMNGDGLPDIVNPKKNDNGGSDWQIYLNTGSNFIHIGDWHVDISSDLITDVDTTGNVQRDLLDINGDGLPDIVDPNGGEGDWRIYFNTGKGFTGRIYWPTIFTDGFIRDVTKPDPDDGHVAIVRDVFDLDGDGMPDIVRKDSSDDDWKIYKNKSGQADLLLKITDTLGGTVAINYTSSMDYSNTRLPFNYWVVSSVETNNGMAGPHALVATTNYLYSQGLYDFPSREFRGFGEVNETRADSSKVIHYYHQDNAKKGKEYKTEILNSSNVLYARSENEWLRPNGTTCVEPPIDGVYTCNLSKTNEHTFDGDPNNAKLKTKYYQNYDSYGNPRLMINEGDASLVGDELYTYDEYWNSCSGKYIVDKLKSRFYTAVSYVTGVTPKLRESFYWYDNRADCVDKGNITKEENWLSGGTNPATLHVYDPYGNRTSTTDPEGRITQTAYDSTYHTFPVQLINAKNQITSRVYDASSGQILSETDANGYTTSYAYDTFKRKIREVKPYDTDPSPTTSIQYVLDGVPPESVIIYRKDGTPTFDTIQSVDGFGNLIQTKSEYESGSNKLAVDVFYDTMGRVKKQSNPYLTGSLLSYSTPDTAVPGTSYSYDPLGRPTLVTNPDATQISRTFDHWVVTEIDENGHRKNYRFDAHQRLLSVYEHPGGGDYETKYSYSPLGELKQIQDYNNNITSIQYDTLGRKTSMVDPDMGQWNYSYDGVGNLISQIDAKAITTNITYDPLNRKTFINYPTSTDIQFTYDTPTIGTLSSVIDAAGTVNYQYDNRLRKKQEDRTIDGQTWTTKWGYDSMDRVISMTYPDNQTIVFNYNGQNKLDSIPGIISGLDYNASGQVIQKNYANGKSTAYTYHPSNLRLSSLATSGLQNFAYTYDNVGNIKSIADGIAGKTENFAYDDLDRLTSAGDSGYSIQYQYNAIGNMTSMTKDGKTTTFSYGAVNNKPHAVKGMTVPFPVVGSLAINNGSAYTTTSLVTLNNVSIGSPTHYMASEDKLFTGASWLTYSTAPTFTLSAGFGTKTIYFKVKNTDGESNVKSDSVEFRLNPSDAYTDTDGDGLSDMLEYIYGTDPNKKDTDGDGKTDFAEVNSGRSDPRIPDTDNDGLNDSKDPYPKSIYHESFSENYGILALFNEGGGSRSSPSYKVKDSLGSAFIRNAIGIQFHPSITVMPGIFDFRAIKIGDSSPISLTISNSGMGDLIIGTIAFTGTNAGEFSKQNDNCSSKTIAQSGTCTLAVIFSPNSTGPKSANLLIPSNAPNTPMLYLPLNAAGTDTAPCTYSIIPDNQVFGSSGGTGSVSVMTQSGCTWTATSNASWITITSGSFGTGNGTVNYSVAVNSSTSQRTGTMTIEGKTLTVIQSGTNQKALNVNITLSGGGTVTGTGINCPGDCSEIYNSGTNITLTETPNSGYVFSSWNGCNSTSPDGKTCYVTMDANKTVTANFASLVSVSKIGVFRNGVWYLDYNGNGLWNGCTTDKCYTFGLSTDIPVAGDWNGDGYTEIGVKRGTNWYLDYNGNGAWDGCITDRCYTFGLSTDIPVAGDWNNSGTDKIGVFRNGSWYLDYNGNGLWNGCATDKCYTFGMAGDKPVAGDWNGDGYAEIGVFRNGNWYLDYDRSDSWSGCGVDECYNFGLSTDTPIVGDWNGDGWKEIGVKRGASWYLDYNGNGLWNGCTTDRCYTFGLSTDKPVVGNW